MSFHVINPNGVTVGDLREFLEGLSDDLPVAVSTQGEVDVYHVTELHGPLLTDPSLYLRAEIFCPTSECDICTTAEQEINHGS